MNQKLRTTIQLWDLKTLGPQKAALKEYERVCRTKFLGKLSIFLANFSNFFHIFLRPQYIPKVLDRDPFKNGSLSENVTKEGESLLFQPFQEAS